VFIHQFSSGVLEDLKSFLVLDNEEYGKMDPSLRNTLSRFWQSRNPADKTRSELYTDKGAEPEILSFVKLTGASLGAKGEEVVNYMFPDLQPRADPGHDRCLGLVKFEIKTSTLWDMKDFKWQHIAMDHIWNVLLFVGIDIHATRFWVLSKEDAKTLVEDGRITNQGHEGKSTQGKWAYYKKIQNDLVEIFTMADMYEFLTSKSLDVGRTTGTRASTSSSSKITLDSANMSTVPELRQMAKKRGITGFSKMVKAELQEKLGLPVTGAPKTVKSSTKVAPRPTARPSVAVGSSSSSAPASSARKLVPRSKGDLLKMLVLSSDLEIKTYIILFSEIDDFNKLLDQASLPLAEREDEAGLNANYTEILQDKALMVLEHDELYEVQDGQRIVYTLTVMS
jgi:hypothetical protein